MSEAGTLLAALTVGLLGGVHCVGMCGGIVAALTMGLPAERRGRPVGVLPYHLAYNAGRVLSYTAIGALLGGAGRLVTLAGLHAAQQFLQVLAGAFLVAMGLYLADWWRGLARVERLGGRLWRRLEPLGRRWIPVRSPLAALKLGLLWGWLPCGLVYSVAIWSLSAGSALQGAALMAAFGLGTLPNLVAMGLFAGQLAGFVRARSTRVLAGLLVVGFGLYTLVGPWGQALPGG